MFSPLSKSLKGGVPQEATGIVKRHIWHQVPGYGTCTVTVPTYTVPDAGEPVGHQHVETQEEDKHGGAILQVPVQLPYHSAQTQ